MPLELDKGHDDPTLGLLVRIDMAERFSRAREIVRRYGIPAMTSPMDGQKTTAVEPTADNPDDIRPPGT